MDLSVCVCVCMCDIQVSKKGNVKIVNQSQDGYDDFRSLLIIAIISFRHSYRLSIILILKNILIIDSKDIDFGLLIFFLKNVLFIFFILSTFLQEIFFITEEWGCYCLREKGFESCEWIYI